MALKKSQLYSSIWASCDELRGGMDASQYKDYVLVLLFVKYVSDKYSGKKDALVEIPQGGSFSDMIDLKGKTDIGEGMNKVVAKLAEANELKGVIDQVDFNDEDKLGHGKDMVDRLTNLVGIFQNPDLNFSKNRADGDDILGDAYEYLMKHFATESGKSKGQFYTPAEVSRIMARIIEAEKAEGLNNTVYDPTCGSGSLLLKVADETHKGISIYGQEMDNSTAALAIMNMWLHNNPLAEIKKGQSTLSSPLHLSPDGSLKTFDYVVANPPFSYKAWTTGFDPSNDSFGRFDGFGIPPAKNGDYAFLLHILKSMKSTGKGAVILPHGVLFRGNSEALIRENVIKRGYIKGIIGLPANLFYGTGIPACIIVLDKAGAANSKGIFIIDASKGFIKDSNKNRLREQDMRKVIDVFNGQLKLPKYSRFIPYAEIEKNEYNLNIPRYIDTQEAEDLQDIESHIKGGIPTHDVTTLQNYWDNFPALESTLFIKGKRPGTFEIKIATDDIRNTIYTHTEFVTFKKKILSVFKKWCDENQPKMAAVTIADKPKEFIFNLGERIINAFDSTPLINKYDVYQHLMNYWATTMQDDLYTLVADGWKAGNEVIRLQKEIKDNKKKDIEGLEGLEGRLIPTSLIISEYFATEKSTIDTLESSIEEATASMEEIKEEHGGEEGLLAEVIDEEKINKLKLAKRVREIKHDPDSADELEILEKYQALLDREADLKKELKSKYAQLEKMVINKYPTLSLEDIKTLVIDKKWLRALEEAINSELERVAQTLTGRVKELAERYDDTLPHIADEVKTLEQKVNEHLKSMGFEI
ncbi:MAG TPA: N-6 DNA methylase [Candidatus Wunengus sp. YC60]|uniref:N-6 DNA methylase n=1 Tax=Candidatus Wunengus sp. YC60 TaxID=3367697 RepID=UPI00402645B6